MKAYMTLDRLDCIYHQSMSVIKPQAKITLTIVHGTNDMRGRLIEIGIKLVILCQEPNKINGASFSPHKVQPMPSMPTLQLRIVNLYHAGGALVESK